MKKLLTERRLCELAGIEEADTLNLAKTREDKKKRARHEFEKDFFGSGADPLVTTDVPQIPQVDPDATREIAPADMKRNELEDLALMAQDQQIPSDFEFASQMAGREVTPDKPLTAKDIRQMVDPMSPEDRLRLTTTISLPFGRTGVATPGGEEDAVDSTRAMFRDPERQQRDRDYLDTKSAGELEGAADRWAVEQVIKLLKKEQPEKYGSLPVPGEDIDYVEDQEIVDQLHREVPRVAPKLYKQLLDQYKSEFA